MIVHLIQAVRLVQREYTVVPAIQAFLPKHIFWMVLIFLSDVNVAMENIFLQKGDVCCVIADFITLQQVIKALVRFALKAHILIQRVVLPVQNALLASIPIP